MECSWRWFFFSVMTGNPNSASSRSSVHARTHARTHTHTPVLVMWPPFRRWTSRRQQAEDGEPLQFWQWGHQPYLCNSIALQCSGYSSIDLWDPWHGESWVRPSVMGLEYPSRTLGPRKIPYLYTHTRTHAPRDVMNAQWDLYKKRTELRHHHKFC